MIDSFSQFIVGSRLSDYEARGARWRCASNGDQRTDVVALHLVAAARRYDLPAHEQDVFVGDSLREIKKLLHEQNRQRSFERLDYRLDLLDDRRLNALRRL